MPSTINELNRRLARGETSCEQLVAEALDGAAQPAAQHVFTRLYADAALAAARAADQARRAGAPPSPLAGLPVTIKDLYDVAGEPTTAGSTVLADAPAATADAPAVARLRASGAAIVGKTAMTEFAFSGVGFNPHGPALGTPRNPCDAGVVRIPGGSSAGAAVSVALGLAVAGLGSDTGGSIRIPAALCGLVGWKSTQSRTPRSGAVELARSFDTVCALARSVDDCLAVDAVLADAPLAVADRPLAGVRLAVPAQVVFDGVDDAVARAFDAAVARLGAAGAQVVQVQLPWLSDIARDNLPGGISSIEAFAAHGHWVDTHRAAIDRRVARRMEAGRGVSAADYLRILDRRAAWIARTTAALGDFDALLCPTVPMIAPALDDLLASDDGFLQTNGLLLRNTFIVNWWDGCAFSLPCHTAGLPVGLMLAAAGGRDAALAGVARTVEQALA